MEGPVKERLTGALILIAALIIVVPEMLSGPDSRQPAAGDDAEAGPPMRTYQLQLDTPSAARSEDQSALSPKPAQTEAPPPAEDPPVVEAAPDVAPAQQAAAASPAEDKPEAAKPAAEKPVAEKPAAEKPAPAATLASAGSWWAQLGSFSARENAERLARQLRTAGYQVSVSPSKSNGKELFRVRAGPVASREAALALQSRLAAAGHKSALVAP